MRLRSHVLIIAAATLLPIITVVCLAVVLLFQKQRNIELDRLVDTARALSLAVDRDFETGLASLRALATSQELRSGDIRTFYDESKRVLAGHEGAEAIILVDPSGQQIINTRRPFGEALPRYGDPSFIEQVVTSRRPAVSNLFIGSIIQRPVISLGVPVMLDGQVKFALTLSLSPSSLQQLLAQGAIAADSLASIIDGNKFIVARTRELDKFFGTPAGPVTIAHTTENHEGWWLVPRQRSQGVEPSYAAHRRSEFSGWTVVIGVPTAKVDAPFWQAFQLIGGGIVVLLGVALGLAAVFGRRITGSIAALSAGAKALGSGDSVAIASSPIVELDQVRLELETSGAARKRVEEKLRYELQLIRNITDSADECIFIADGDGDVKFANPAAVKTFGFGLHELLGQSLHETLHHSYVDGRPFPKSDCVLGRTRVSGSTIRNHEDVFFRKDGSPVIVECSSAPVEIDGKKIGAILIARDIGERKFNQEALQTSEQSIRRLYAITNDTQQSFEVRVRALLNLGCERYRMPIGSLTKLNGDQLELQFVQSSSDPNFTDGMMVPLSSSYCRSVMDADGPLCFEHVGASEWRNHPGYLALGLESYMGTRVLVEGRVYGTLCYFGREPRTARFTDADKDFLKLMSVWIGGELDRRQAVQELRASRDELELRVEERTAELSRSNLLLRQKEEQLLLAQRAGHTGLWSRDLTTGKASMSSEWYDLMGFPLIDGPVSHAEFLDRIHRDDRLHVKETSLRQENGDFDREFRILHPVKGERWIFSRGRRAISTEDGHLHMMGALIDITERKQTEEALRRSEERLQHALTVGSMGLWERDLQTGKVQWDRRNFELLGIDVETSVNLEMLFSRIHPDDLPVVKRALERTHSTGEVYVSEYRVLKPDGKIIWLHANGGLRRDRDGTPTHLAGINFDITERKAAEVALRILNEQLDQRVAQRTQELAESQAKLRTLVAELTKAEERERRRLAVELHDYLAQSLTATRMNLSRAEKFVSGSIGNSDLKEILYDVHSDLNNSINYTRTLIGELSPRVLYDLGLPAALGWLGEQMGRHGLIVEVDGPLDDFSLAENDAVFLFQCARELLWNVVKHGATNRATVAYGRDGNRVSLAVVDKGKGFDPQAAHESGDDGTHLGLFSIRERVELRGGQVEIDSTPGVGTWVTIILPVDASEEVSSMMVEQKPPVRVLGESVRIVIVDDHKMVRQGLRRVLEEHDDFSIVGEAGDGAAAVAMARELEPHVVIMDVNLPTMSGIDATRDIVRERPSTIVIGLSFGSDSYVSQAMQAAGAATCIAKERAVEDVRQAILDAVAVMQGAAAH